MSSRLVLVALVASVCLNFVLIYRVFDMGVMDTSRSDEIQRREHQAKTAEKLLLELLPATSRGDLRTAAQRAGLEVLDKGDEGMYVGGIQFVLSKDRISAIWFN